MTLKKPTAILSATVTFAWKTIAVKISDCSANRHLKTNGFLTPARPPPPKTTFFTPRQQVRENPNGSLTVSFRAGGVLELDRCLYGWGPHVKVIKPKNWKHMVREAKKHV